MRSPTSSSATTETTEFSALQDLSASAVVANGTADGATPGATGPDSSPTRTSDSPPAATHNLYVRNLPPELKAEEFVQLFEAFGPVASHRLMVDVRTGRPRGFGYVLLREADDAAAAKNALTGMALYGRPLEIEYASTAVRVPGPPSPRVFVRHLPHAFTADDVRELCAPEPVVAVTLVQEGHDRGAMAHVTLESADAAERIARRLNNSTRFMRRNVAPEGAPAPGLASALAATAARRPLEAQAVPTGEAFPAPRPQKKPAAEKKPAPAAKAAPPTASADAFRPPIALPPGSHYQQHPHAVAAIGAPGGAAAAYPTAHQPVPFPIAYHDPRFHAVAPYSYAVPSYPSYPHGSGPHDPLAPTPAGVPFAAPGTGYLLAPASAPVYAGYAAPSQPPLPGRS